MLDLLLTNTVQLIGDIRIGGCLGCSDHALVEFVILRNVGLAKSRVRILNFSRLSTRKFSSTHCRKCLGLVCLVMLLIQQISE